MQKASSWVTLWPPLGLGILAAIARKKGHAVRLIDNNVDELTMDSLLTALRSEPPDMIVMTTGFPSIDDDMTVAGAIKTALPHARIVCFGVYFTLLGKEALAPHPSVDIGISGEPEETFSELIDQCASSHPDLSSVKGLIFHQEGAIIATQPRALLADLDQLPHPARDLFKASSYTLPHNGQPFTLINTARGCPYHCIFCIVESYYGNVLRKHSVPYVMEEIVECVMRYGIHEFLFWEEVFTLNREYCLALCNAIIASGHQIRWAATTRVDCLDEELLATMKKAGCYLLGLGIESSNEKILQESGKRTTITAITAAVQLCKKTGIKTMGHFIFGLPGETPETAEETICFMQKLGLDYMQCYCAVPYPGTQLGERAVKMGWVQNAPWSAYDFGGNSILNLPTISAVQVGQFREKAFKRFYLRPWYMLKTAFRDIRPRQALHMTRFFDWIRLTGKKGS